FFALPALFSLFLFVSTLRLPLASTLFPYTTLFRSAALGRPPLPADRGSLDGRRRRPLRARLGAALARSRAAVRGTAAARGGPALDRKSTRLNSSHSPISYAVFCLKKKKPRQIH